MQAHRRLEILDGVEVAILTQQGAPERRDHRGALAATCEIASDQRSRLVHLLLTVKQCGQRFQQFARVWPGRSIWGRHPPGGHVEEAVQIYAHRRVESAAQ